MLAVLERTRVQGRAPRARWVLWPAGFLFVGAVAITALYLTVPESNEGDGPVDALVVLGTPAEMHGELTEMQRWRVDEAVREYKAGRAAHLVITGGPTSHGFVEADVMAAYARQLGVPAGAIVEERRSMTTVQNVHNTVQLLHQHGWHSVEVISTAEHLRRAAVLWEKTGLAWRVHAAPTPGRSRTQIAGAYAEEAFGTAVLRIFGERSEPVLHALAVVQHALGYSCRWLFYKVEGRLNELGTNR